MNTLNKKQLKLLWSIVDCYKDKSNFKEYFIENMENKFLKIQQTNNYNKCQSIKAYDIFLNKFISNDYLNFI